MPASDGRRATPRPSASLILIRQTPQGQEVLVGRRSSKNRFLPGIFAFPGGRLDPVDHRPSGFAEAFKPPGHGIDRQSRTRFAAFVRAAFRETLEETGLLIGRSGSAPAHVCTPVRAHSVWPAYARGQVTPAFEAARLVARAITPARSPIRFHNRFLLCDGALAQGRLGGSGELDDLGWVPVSEALALPMGEIGTLALQEALAHLNARHGRGVTRFGWKGPQMRPNHHQPSVRKAKRKAESGKLRS